MKAAVYSEYGEAEVLSIKTDIAVVPPTASQVVIKVAAVSLFSVFPTSVFPTSILKEGVPVHYLRTHPTISNHTTGFLYSPSLYFLLTPNIFYLCTSTFSRNKCTKYLILSKSTGWHQPRRMEASQRLHQSMATDLANDTRLGRRGHHCPSRRQCH